MSIMRELAEVATVSQLRTALKLEPRPEPEPEPDPRPEPQRSITKTTDEQFSYYRIKLGHTDAATFDAALQSHHDALITEWKHDHDKAITTRDRDRPRRRSAAPVAEHR